MGKHFGNLQKLKGVTYYSLSPMELNPFLGLFNPGFPNFIRRLTRVVLIGIIPASITYLTYDWATTTYHHSLRKNPEDYKNDV